MSVELSAYAGEDFCYLTTIGRVSGRPHEIEIWFVLHESTFYLLAGSHSSDWVKNLRQHPAATLRVGTQTLGVQGRVVTDPAEDALARQLVLAKYQPRDSDDLGDWGRTALPVALDVDAATN